MEQQIIVPPSPEQAPGGGGGDGGAEVSHNGSKAGRDPSATPCNDVHVTISCGPGAAEGGLRILSPVKVLNDADVNSNMPQGHATPGASASYVKNMLCLKT
jgi:hypothetical protein